MYPFMPPTLPPFNVTPAASFARVRSIHLTDPDSLSSELNSTGKAAAELTAWSAKMRFQRSDRIAFDPIRSPKILPFLSKAFKNGERVEMRGEFGHVVWPLFVTGQKVLEPVLNGAWSFAKFIEWSAQQKNNLSVFLPKFVWLFL